jgi:hypothetical protein
MPQEKENERVRLWSGVLSLAMAANWAQAWVIDVWVDLCDEADRRGMTAHELAKLMFDDVFGVYRQEPQATIDEVRAGRASEELRFAYKRST